MRNVVITPEGGIIRLSYGKLEAYGKPLPIYGRAAEEALKTISEKLKTNDPILYEDNNLVIFRFPKFVAVKYGRNWMLYHSGGSLLIDDETLRDLKEETSKKSTLTLISSLAKKVMELMGEVEALKKSLLVEDMRVEQNTKKIEEAVRAVEELHEQILSLTDEFTKLKEKIQNEVETSLEDFSEEFRSLKEGLRAIEEKRNQEKKQKEKEKVDTQETSTKSSQQETSENTNQQ